MHVCVCVCEHAGTVTTEWDDMVLVIHMLSSGAWGCRISNVNVYICVCVCVSNRQVYDNVYMRLSYTTGWDTASVCL